MSKFKVELSGDVTGSYSKSNEFDPKDFLHCKSIDDVKDILHEDLWESAEGLDIDDWYCSLDVPEEFIKEWHKLKNESDE